MRSCGVCWGNTGLADCKDDDTRCSSWAAQGHCTSRYDYMRTTCKRACSHCPEGGTATTSGPIVTGRPGECIDGHSKCSEWASEGECDKNPIWMKENCRVSCGTCDGGPTPSTPSTGGPPTNPPGNCKDDNSRCEEWAGKGECEANPEYMLVNCKLSCKACDDMVCSDNHVHCASWASKG